MWLSSQQPQSYSQILKHMKKIRFSFPDLWSFSHSVFFSNSLSLQTFNVVTFKKRLDVVTTLFHFSFKFTYLLTCCYLHFVGVFPFLHFRPAIFYHYRFRSLGEYTYIKNMNLLISFKALTNNVLSVLFNILNNSEDTCIKGKTYETIEHSW